MVELSPIYTLCAALPIISVLVTLIVFRWPAMQAMLFSLGVTLLLALVVWQVRPAFAAAALVEGIVIALSIAWIVLGALALISVLSAAGHLASIRQGFVQLSPDPRVQAIVIAWCFGAFLEGASGFGAPAAITGPLLYALGFHPALAASLALIADSSPVSFGAAGTPVLIGLGQGLSDPAAAGLAQANPINAIALQAISIDVFVGSWIPLVMMWVLLRFSGSSHLGRDMWAVLPVAIIAGLSFTGTAWLTARFLGPEFPSILGGLASLLATIVYIKARRDKSPPSQTLAWNVASQNKPLASREPAGINKHVDEGVDQSFSSSSHSSRSSHPGNQVAHDRLPAPLASFAMPLWQAWLPYLAVAILLVASRLNFLPLKSVLNSVVLNTGSLFGTPVQASVSPLYLPGFIFFTVALVTLLIYRKRFVARSSPVVLAAELLKKMLPIIFTLAAAVPLVRLFIHSSGNTLGLPAMPIALAEWLAQSFGVFWPYLSVATGALGSFISGSATFSNMLFADLQAAMAMRLEVPTVTVLALQMLGANAGNMVCVVNVVAAASVVGLAGKESTIMRLTAGPMLFYLVIAGSIAWLFAG